MEPQGNAVKYRPGRVADEHMLGAKNVFPPTETHQPSKPERRWGHHASGLQAFRCKLVNQRVWLLPGRHVWHLEPRSGGVQAWHTACSRSPSGLPHEDVFLECATCPKPQTIKTPKTCNSKAYWLSFVGALTSRNEVIVDVSRVVSMHNDHCLTPILSKSPCHMSARFLNLLAV